MTAWQPNPRFLTTEEVMVLHQLAISEFGGASGILDAGLLDSALAQPQASMASAWLHEYPFGMAAAYGYHLALNHPFVDGNKRVAWSALRVFLFREGYQLRVPAAEAIQIMLELAAGKVEKSALCEWLKERGRPRPSLELRNFFLDLSFEQLSEKLVGIADSYKSGGPVELTAIVNEASGAIPALTQLAFLYQNQRSGHEYLIYLIQLLCALYRIAEEKGYEW